MGLFAWKHTTKTSLLAALLLVLLAGFCQAAPLADLGSVSGHYLQVQPSDLPSENCCPAASSHFFLCQAESQALPSKSLDAAKNPTGEVAWSLPMQRPVRALALALPQLRTLSPDLLHPSLVQQKTQFLN